MRVYKTSTLMGVCKVSRNGTGELSFSVTHRPGGKRQKKTSDIAILLLPVEHKVEMKESE